MITLGYSVLALALAAALVNAAVKWGDRRRCEWANETAGDDG